MHIIVPVDRFPVFAAQLLSLALSLLLLAPLLRIMKNTGIHPAARSRRRSSTSLAEAQGRESVLRPEVLDSAENTGVTVKQSADLHSAPGLDGAVEEMEMSTLTSAIRTAPPLTRDSVYTEVIADLEDKDLEALRRTIRFRHVLRFISVYGIERVAEDYRKYDDVNVLEVFSRSFENELRADPFYHVDREYDPDKFFYREQAWNALGGTLRRKYKIARTADRALMKARAAATVSYEASSGMSISASPGIEGINEDDFSLRLRVKRLAGIERIDARIGQNYFEARIGKSINAFGQGSRFYLEYEYDGESENDGESQEHISRVCLEVPLW